MIRSEVLNGLGGAFDLEKAGLTDEIQSHAIGAEGRRVICSDRAVSTHNERIVAPCVTIRSLGGDQKKLAVSEKVNPSTSD
jgi:hypothetical protein